MWLRNYSEHAITIFKKEYILKLKFQNMAIENLSATKQFAAVVSRGKWSSCQKSMSITNMY